MPKVKVRYFAVFRDRAGRDTEEIDSEAMTAGDLYVQLQPRLGLDAVLVRIAVNGDFVESSYPLKDGDEVVFVPPVAGG